jgi:hypothetical protein
MRSARAVATADDVDDGANESFDSGAIAEAHEPPAGPRRDRR